MKTRWIVWCLICLCCLSGCSSSPVSHEFFAMDTVMKITVYSEKDQDLLSQAEEQIRFLESLLSVTNPQSEIYRVNGAKGVPTSLSDQTVSLLQTAQGLWKETDGLFDITVYPAVKAWGFTQSENRVPTDKEQKALLPLIDCGNLQLQENTLTLPKGVLIDLGGIAKGYAADVVAESLTQKGCQGGVLSLGGNVKTLGNKSDGSLFQIAVQDPNNTTATLGTLSVSGNTAVVTSGDSQRYFEQDGVKYHHIIDPRTAAPAVSDLTAVTVVCKSATKADAYATALYIMGLEKGMKKVQQTQGMEALFITIDGQIHLSEGLKPIFTENQ